MTVNMKKPLIIICILAAAAGIYFYMHRNSDEGLTFYGNVDIRQISLAFNGSERIEKIFVEEGDSVKKGDVLAELNTETLKLNIARSKAAIARQEAVLLKLRNGSRPEEIRQSEAAVRAAQADCENARLYKDRIAGLYARSAVSRQEFDNAEAQYKAAAANLEKAYEAMALSRKGPREEDIAEAEANLQGLKAELALQEYNLGQSRLLAPAGGVIRSRLQEPGDMTSPQSPVFLLAVNGKKWVRAYIPETRLGQVKPGMEAKVYIDSMPGTPLKGQVGYISDVAEFTPKTVQTEELRTSLLYEMRVYVEDEDGVLRMGMPATVKLD